MSSTVQGLAHSRRSQSVRIMSTTVVHSFPSSVPALGSPGATGDAATSPCIIPGSGQHALPLPGDPSPVPVAQTPWPRAQHLHHPPLGGFPQTWGPTPPHTLLTALHSTLVHYSYASAPLDLIPAAYLCFPPSGLLPRCPGWQGGSSPLKHSLCLGRVSGVHVDGGRKAASRPK